MKTPTRVVDWSGGAVIFAAVMLVGCYKTVSTSESGPAKAQQEKKDLVEFEFAWKTPMRLEAETTRRVRKMGGSARAYRATAVLDVSSRNDRIVVATTPQFEGVTGDAVHGGTGEVLGAASLVAVPATEVRDDGSFEGVRGVDAIRTTFMEAARRTSGGSLSKDVVGALDAMLTDDLLEQRARQRWDVLVGMWAGETMEVGMRYDSRTTDEFVLPLVGRRRVDMEVDFGVEERLSCGGGSESECVRVTIRSRPDIRKMKELVQKWVDEYGRMEAKRRGMAAAPKLTVAEVFVRTEFSLKTEIATLRPRRLVEKRTQRLKLRDPNGAERVFRTVDERTTTYRVVD